MRRLTFAWKVHISFGARHSKSTRKFEIPRQEGIQFKFCESRVEGKRRKRRREIYYGNSAIPPFGDVIELARESQQRSLRPKLLKPHRRDLPDMMSAWSWKVDVEREVAWISEYKSDPNADKGGSKNPKILRTSYVDALKGWVKTRQRAERNYDARLGFPFLIIFLASVISWESEPWR